MHHATSQINWTQVLLVGIPAYIGALAAGVAAVITALNRRNLKTPSGDRIGNVVERTHDLAAVTTAATTGARGPVVKQALRRLNGGLGASLTTAPSEATTGDETQ